MFVNIRCRIHSLYTIYAVSWLFRHVHDEAMEARQKSNQHHPTDLIRHCSGNHFHCIVQIENIHRGSNVNRMIIHICLVQVKYWTHPLPLNGDCQEPDERHSERSRVSELFQSVERSRVSYEVLQSTGDCQSEHSRVLSEFHSCQAEDEGEVFQVQVVCSIC